MSKSCELCQQSSIYLVLSQDCQEKFTLSPVTGINKVLQNAFKKKTCTGIMNRPCRLKKDHSIVNY